MLAPWAYFASVLYHDTFWYPFVAKKQMAEVLESPWGRLFRDWENVTADENGYPAIGKQPAQLKKTGFAAFRESLRILWLCIKESPEFAQRRQMTTSSKR